MTAFFLVMIAFFTVAYAVFCATAAWVRQASADRAEKWCAEQRARVDALRAGSPRPDLAAQHASTIRPELVALHAIQLAAAEADLIRAAGAADAAFYEATNWSLLAPWRERVLLSERISDARRWRRTALRRAWCGTLPWRLNVRRWVRKVVRRG